MKKLLQKIEKKKAIVGVIGLGYIGKALAHHISKEGYKVIGFDIDKKKVESINKEKIFSAENTFKNLKKCDILSINVQTPLKKNKPDLFYIKNAAKKILKNLRKDQLIILESTVSVGTTRKILLPILEKSALKAGKDFFLSFSSERIDLSMKKYNIKNTPKVIGALEKNSLILTEKFYEKIVDKVIVTSSLEIAEMSKLLENVFRFININFINEISQYLAKKNIDIQEVIKAASSKPFGFMPFYPGSGVSGHCVFVNPFYLLDDAIKNSIPLSIVKKNIEFHEKRIQAIISKSLKILKNKKNVLIIGITEKEEVEDVRESVGLKISSHLFKKNKNLSFHDPYVNRIGKKRSLPISWNFLKKQDLIIMITYHKNIDYDLILKSGIPIIDTKSRLPIKDNIYRI